MIFLQSKKSALSENEVNEVKKDNQEETMSFAQQLINEGIEQGIEIGRLEGSIQQL